MFRTCIAAISVMVEYLSNYQFVFHMCPLFISDTGSVNFLSSSACRTISSRIITLIVATVNILKRTAVTTNSNNH